MKLFQVGPDENLNQDYTFNVSHKWSLPGIECDLCGWQGAISSMAYPRVLLPDGIDPTPYQNSWPVTPERLSELKGPLRSSIDESLPLEAGIEFGPLTGICVKRGGSFTWTNYRVPLISTVALKDLYKIGIKTLTSVKTALALKSGEPLDYYELEIEAFARLDFRFLPKDALISCARCGIKNMYHTRSGWNENPIVLSDSVPVNSDLFRIQYLDNVIVSSERLMQAVKHLNLSNIVCQEMRVS